MAVTEENSGLADGEILAIYFSLLVIAIFVIVLWFRRGLYIVKHTEVIVLERFGKYHRTLKPGFHLAIPLVDTPRFVNWRYVTVPFGSRRPEVKTIDTYRIDLREHLVTFGSQRVITRDTVQLEVDALVYYSILDPRLAVFSVRNLPDAIELLSQSTLRNIIAHMTLDDTFSSRDAINQALREQTFTDCERWGVKIHRLEIFNIKPPNDLKAVMERQIQEERQRRATVLEADGEREASIIRSVGEAAKLVIEAEGVRKAMIQKAKGTADSRLLQAKGESKAIELIQSSIEDKSVRASDYIIAQQYLEMLGSKVGRESKVVLIPSNVVDGISMIGELQAANSSH